MKQLMLGIMIMCCISSSYAETRLPQTRDFAYGRSIVFEAGAPLYQFAIPADVYQKTVYADFSDIRIFDPAGKLVPFMIRTPQPTSNTAATQVPFFPIFGTIDRKNDLVQLQLQKNNQGAIIAVSQQNAKKDNETIQAYIIDLSHLTQNKLSKIIFHWKSSKSNWINPIVLAGSNDLRHWTTINSQGSLAQLENEGRQIIQRESPYLYLHYKYLMLTWPANKRDFDLTKVMVATKESAAPVLNEANIVGTTTLANPGKYYFDTQGRFPISQVNLLLPQSNVALNSKLFSRPAEQDAWNLHFQGLLYNYLIDHDKVRNPWIDVNLVNNRYWELDIKPYDALGSSVPQLQIRWQPTYIVFAGIGEGPYLLAYGSAYVDTPEHTLQALYGKLINSQQQKIQSAVLQEQRLLSGDVALTAEKVTNYRQWLLWGVLVLGVLVLMAMVVGLFQQLRRHVNETDPL